MDIRSVSTFNSERESVSNWQLAEVLNNIHIGFFSKNIIANKYLSFSEGLPDIYGYTVGDFYEDPDLWYKVILPEDRPVTEQEMRVLKTGDKSIAQYRIRHRKGGIRWLEVKTFPLFENEILTCVEGVIYDITERKEAELELIRAKQFSDCIVNSLPGIFYLFDEQGNYVNWNDNFEKITGYSAQEIRTFKPTDLIHEDDKAFVRTKMSDAFEYGSDEVEARLVTKSGNEIMYYFSGQKVTIQGTNYLAGMGIDISKRKAAEDKVQQHERMLSCILDSIPQAILWKDSSSRFLGANKVFAKMAGVDDPESIVGKTDFDFSIVKEEAHRFRQDDLKVINTKQPMLHYVEALSLSDGNIAWHDTSKIPLKDENDNVHGVLVVIDDITEKKLKEDNLKKLNNELIQKNVGLTDFSYIVSHNLRAPIAKVLGLASLFDRNDGDAELNKEVIGYIATEVNNLDSIIKDLSAILANQSAAGKLMEEVCLEDVLINTQQLYAEEINHFQAVLSFNFSHVKKITTVKSYIQSVFNHLISNALRYKHPNRTPEIIIESSKVGEFAVISFQDNGLGLDLDRYGDKVYGIYNNFNPGTRNGKGIGLRLVKTQVEAVGGKIELESTVGAGSTFKVFLPLE